MRNPEETLNFRSDDGRFSFELPQSQRLSLLSLCRAAARTETGGVLIGHYSDDHHGAMATQVLGPPSDSRRAPRAFERGWAGLNSILRRVWKGQREFYLGEWHFHPGAAATPSPKDMIAMRTIALDANYRCPEPILLIVGGSEDVGWQLGVSVFPSDGPQVLLRPIVPST